jgi:hypothetical protein
MYFYVEVEFIMTNISSHSWRITNRLVSKPTSNTVLAIHHVSIQEVRKFVLGFYLCIINANTRAAIFVVINYALYGTSNLCDKHL